MKWLGVLGDSYSLLDRKLRRSFNGHLLLAAVQACIELGSVVVLVPLVSYLSRSGNQEFPLTASKLPLFDSMERLSLIIVLVYMVKNAFSLWCHQMQAAFIGHVTDELSLRQYRLFFKLNWLDYLEGSTPEFIRKIKSTPSDFAHHVLHNIMRVASDLLVMLFIITALVIIDHRAILVVLALAVPALLIHQAFRKTTQRMDRSFREITPATSISLSAGVDSFAEINIYGKSDFFIGRFMSLRTAASRLLAGLKTATQIPSLVFELIGVGAICLIVVIAGKFFDTARVVELVGLTVLSIYKLFPLVSRMLSNSIQIKAYSHTVSELMDWQNRVQEQTERHEPLEFRKNISLRDVSFSYRSRDGFRIERLNLEIEKGEFVVIHGPSGSGKSTLLHILAGLIGNYTGTILVDGKTLNDSRQDWLRMVGFVPQNHAIIQDSILMNIAFGETRPDLARVDRALQMAGLSDFVRSLQAGIQTWVGENGLNLSGGQRQRLALARALYRSPQVLLLDEVTSHLDPETKAGLLSNLHALRQTGITVILCTHDASAHPFATQILNLRQGQITG